MKYAVYVEGLAELYFVADVLQKYSGYNPQKCGFLCINLNADNFNEMSNPKQGSHTSANYYQIVNVNNDNLVISKLQKDIPRLIGKGYGVILGLKDVYGDVYRQMTNSQHIVDRTQIKKMHTAQTKAIGAQGCDCRLHFSIMEYEAWMLALIENYVKGKGKDLNVLSQQLGFNIEADYEQIIYHPYPWVKKIFQMCGENYNKHGKEALSFLSTLTVDDYEKLRTSGRCTSFAKFVDSLLGNGHPVLP